MQHFILYLYIWLQFCKFMCSQIVLEYTYTFILNSSCIEIALHNLSQQRYTSLFAQFQTIWTRFSKAKIKILKICRSNSIDKIYFVTWNEIEEAKIKVYNFYRKFFLGNDNIFPETETLNFSRSKFQIYCLR